MQYNDLSELREYPDIPFVSSTLAKQILQRFSIIVDPTHKLVICNDCERTLSPNNVHGHRKRHGDRESASTDFEKRLPAKGYINNLLLMLGATRKIPSLSGSIPRIPGITLYYDGLRCTLCSPMLNVFRDSARVGKHVRATHGCFFAAVTMAAPVDRYHKIGHVRGAGFQYVAVNRDSGHDADGSSSAAEMLLRLSIANRTEKTNFTNLYTTDRASLKDPLEAHLGWGQAIPSTVSRDSLRLLCDTKDLMADPSFQRISNVLSAYFMRAMKIVDEMHITIRAEIVKES